AFAVNPVNGSLRLLNMRQSFGSGPCHVSIGKKGDVLALANYGSGSIALFELNSDGSLGTEKSVIQHRGSSVNPGRQEGPHPHSANFNPEDNRVIVPDLGLDALLVYEIDRGRLALKPEPERFPSRPGAGPRHLAFHPDLRHAYVSNELDSTVTVLTYNREDFSFKAVQVISALPAGTEVFSTSADIHIHPSGGFLYVSNRGHDSIAVFTVNRTDGSLTAAGHEPTRGRTPRNFLVSEDGRFLLAANQDTDTVATFAINDKTGGLSHVRTEEILSPVCLVTRCY
ncbi:MAG: lactonase family protein, partial [Spirochaetales bacterium]